MGKRLTFGERVLLLRRRRKLSQAQLATLLGVCERTVQHIEEDAGYERKLKLSTRSKLDILERRKPDLTPVSK